MSVKTLAKKVVEREAFLRLVLNFVERIVHKHGRETEYEERSDHINSEKELMDFGGFDFKWKQSRGNSIEVFCALSGSLTKVLYMNYWHTGIEGCQVYVFSEDAMWQKAFANVVKNTDKILAEKRLICEQEREKAQKELSKAKVLQALAEKAKRLGLVV